MAERISAKLSGFHPKCVERAELRNLGSMLAHFVHMRSPFKAWGGSLENSQSPESPKNQW